MRSSALSPVSSPERFSQVDSLRAIACALVVVSHGDFLFPDRLHERGVGAAFIDIAHVGVLMFFAISGFVIPNSLRGARWKGFKDFWARRFWRLYPPYWGALLLTWLIGESFPLRQWLWSLTMLPHSFGSPRVSVQFWTLEVELIFYGIVALLFLVTGRLGWRVLSTAYIACGVGLALFPHSVEWLPTRYLIIMFWGALCREVLRFDFSRWHYLAPWRGVDWARSVVLGGITGLLMLRHLAWGGLGLLEGDPSATLPYLPLVTAAFGFLFWALLTPVRIAWLSRVGRWTYSTYLLHWVVTIGGFLPFVPHLEKWPVGLYYAALLFVSFGVGGVAYRWIEQPSDRIGKRLTRRRTA